MSRRSTLDDLSIVIVTYKGDTILKNCIDSLFSARVAVDRSVSSNEAVAGAEIIVVDNSPNEATKALVLSYAGVRYIASPGNPGFAGGNNRAMPYCRRNYVLLLNNDTIVRTAESVTRLIEFLDEHPKCGVAGGTGILPKADNALCGCGAFLSPLGNIWSYGLFNHPTQEEAKTKQCFAVGGYFFMFRLEVLWRTCGLFHSHFWCYYEEIDFCHRVWLAGYEVWYVNTPPIDHLMNETSRNFSWPIIMRRYLRNILFSLQVNLSLPARLWFVNSFRFLIVARGFYHLLRDKDGRAQFKSHIMAIVDDIRDRRYVLAARRRIKRKRVRSDREVLRHVTRIQPLASLRSSI